MTFHNPITPDAAPATTLRSADLKGIDLKSIFRTLSAVAPRLGLSPGVLATLRAMIACVRPERGLICFASTATLLRLRSGGSDRTIRRHAEMLAEAGVLVRHDSPNGKRYAAVDRTTGASEAFGFDLGPMALQAPLWEALAEEMAIEDSRRRYLRTVILGRLHQLDLVCDVTIDTAQLRTTLRRRLSLTELEAILSTVADIFDRQTASAAQQETEVLSVTGGQNVRLQSKTETKVLESEKLQDDPAMDCEADLLRTVAELCTEATAFAAGPVRSWKEIRRLCWMLAPMMGIEHSLLVEASVRQGAVRASVILMIVLQNGHRIRSMGAYYRAVTLGPKSADFDVARALEGLRSTGLSCR